MKKSILMSALLLCIAPSVFGQEDELKTATERKIKNNNIINKEEAERIQNENLVRDIPYIKNDIKNEFLEWAKKGEFELSKEHFERIQNERVEKLHQVITDCLAKRLDENGIYSYYGIKIELDTYNADEKIYPITINKIYSGGRFKFSVKNNIPLEREDAIDLKKVVDNYEGWYRFFPKEGSNWFVKDGFFVPINIKYGDRLIKISDKGNYPLFSEYVFNTNDLGLSEYFPENYTFTLKDYIKSRKKSRRKLLKI